MRKPSSGNGFVRKTSADEDLTHAVRTVARGEIFLYPSPAKLLLERYKDADADRMRGPLSKLTERERDVLAMTRKGSARVRSVKSCSSAQRPSIPTGAASWTSSSCDTGPSSCASRSRRDCFAPSSRAAPARPPYALSHGVAPVLTSHLPFRS